MVPINPSWRINNFLFINDYMTKFVKRPSMFVYTYFIFQGNTPKLKRWLIKGLFYISPLNIKLLNLLECTNSNYSNTVFSALIQIGEIIRAYPHSISLLITS